MSYDYDDFLEDDNEKDKHLEELADLAQRQHDAQQQVETAQKQLKDAQDLLREISEKHIPELMDKLQLSSVKTLNGLDVEIKETIRASVPKPKEHQFFQWLRDNNESGMIKNIVEVRFARGEDEKAQEAMSALRNMQTFPEQKESVHSQTLKSWVSNRLEQGEEVPDHLVHVHRQRTAKVKQ